MSRFIRSNGVFRVSVMTRWLTTFVQHVVVRSLIWHFVRFSLVFSLCLRLFFHTPNSFIDTAMNDVLSVMELIKFIRRQGEYQIIHKVI